MKIFKIRSRGFFGCNIIKKFFLNKNSKILDLFNSNNYNSHSVDEKKLLNLKQLKNFKFIRLGFFLYSSCGRLDMAYFKSTNLLKKKHSKLVILEKIKVI